MEILQVGSASRNKMKGKVSSHYATDVILCFESFGYGGRVLGYPSDSEKEVIYFCKVLRVLGEFAVPSASDVL